MIDRHRPPTRAALVLGSLAFVLYGLTSPPGITWRHLGEDGAEFAAVGKTFGVTHPTGYPLFTMLLRLVSVGAAETAWRATLLSNIAGAIGVVLATLLFYEVAVLAAGGATDTRARIAALAGSLTAGILFAISPLWWSQSIIIEVYALHLCFVCFALLMAFRYRGRPRRLWILAYAAGLALTHHLQFVLLAPSLLILVLGGWRQTVASSADPDHPEMLPAADPALPRGWPLAILFFLLPITLYLVLPLRSRHNPDLDWGNPENLKQLFWVMRGEQYRFRMFHSKLPEILKHATEFLSTKFPPQFGWSVLPIGLIGIAALARRARLALLALVTYAVIQLVFTANYAIPDPDAYYLPIILVWAGLIAAGITTIMGFARSKVAVLVIAGLVLLGPAVTFPAHYRLLSLDDETVAEDYARNAMTMLPPNSLVLSDGDGRTFSLWYKRETLGRKDVTVLYKSLFVWPWYTDNVAQRDTTFRITVLGRPMPEVTRHVIVDNWDRRPVFATYDDSWLSQNFKVRPEGGLFRVMSLRHPWRVPDGPMRWKTIDLTTSANADYRYDPFTPGSRDSSGLFPGLGGGSLYWGTLPLVMAKPQRIIGKPTVFTTAHQPHAFASFPLFPDSTKMVVLLLDGGAIGRASLRLGEARVTYATGPADTVEIRSYDNVWDYAAESYEIALPEDAVAWYGPLNQSLTVLPITTDPNRIPLALELEGEGPTGDGGEAAGYTAFAATQWLLR